MALFPIFSLYGATLSGQGAVSISATVPFNNIFAAAVANNSTIALRNPIIFTGQRAKITTIFSNGETNFKKESFACDFRDEAGVLKLSYRGNVSESREGVFDVAVSKEMMGKNIIQCRATGYEQDIVIVQQATLLVLPSVGDALSFLY